MRTLFALCTLFAALSKVECHGGLAIPFNWVDINEQGDSALDHNQMHTGAFFIGCNKFKDGMQWKGKPMESISKHPDKMKYDKQGLDQAKLERRMNDPNCYYLFLNDRAKWSINPKQESKLNKKALNLLNKTYGKDIPRMPREMFLPTNHNNTFKIDRANKCSAYDLTTKVGLETYAKKCFNPWFRPGFTAKTKFGYKLAPCGVSGGLPGAALAPYAQRAEKYTYPNAPTTMWTRGQSERVVWNIHANHAGGVSYRLCKVPKQGEIAGITEECFQKTPLAFDGTTRRVRAEDTSEWVTVPAKQSTVGTWPVGSMWRANYFFDVKDCNGVKKCVDECTLARKGNGDCRGQMEDYVKVPADIPGGDYVLSWRWDAEASPQIWSGCANVFIA